ncbi:MAG TPA: DUF6249 domain-containing protein [Bacteroidota bacterium]|nr:DUF6249 domain-containing protein [Bacteroidota bacterium]
MPITVAVFVIFMFLCMASVIGAAIFARHRERMAMIDKGLKGEDMKAYFEKSIRHWSPLTSLKWGIVLVGVGAAILVGLWLHEAYGVNHGVIPALIALFGGASLVLFYLIARRRENS